MTEFWLGPVGALRPLPSPSRNSGPDATTTRYGTVHRGLNGTPTVDTLAMRRTWVLRWPYLDAGAAGYLDALWRGMSDQPLRLLDPQIPNLLPTRITTGGTVTRTAEGFLPSAGTLAWSRAVVPLGVPVGGGLYWQVPAAASGPILTGTDPAVLVDEQPVTLSLWCRSPIDYTPRLSFSDAAGGAPSTVTGPVIPAAATWTRAVFTTVPPTGSALCRASIRLALNNSQGQVATTAWQLETGSTATAWTPGGATSGVVIESLTLAYPVPGRHAVTLTLLET